jgi:hypothetical protein
LFVSSDGAELTLQDLVLEEEKAGGRRGSGLATMLRRASGIAASTLGFDGGGLDDADGSDEGRASSPRSASAAEARARALTFDVNESSAEDSIGSVDYFFVIGASPSTWTSMATEASAAAKAVGAVSAAADDEWYVKSPEARAAAKLKALALQPGIVCRYPSSDYSNSMLPVDDGLSAFVFPLGFEVKLFPRGAPRPRPKLFTTVLTDEKVSSLCTVTFHANLAHNLTRSP